MTDKNLTGAAPKDESKVKLTPTQSGLPPVPTTKILAMGNIPTPLTLEQRKALGHKELSATVRLYLAGKIDQWWYRQDGHGVVFLMNVTSVDEARELLESLPFGQAKLLKFDLLPGSIGASAGAPRSPSSCRRITSASGRH
jgi:hypothetical protein